MRFRPDLIFRRPSTTAWLPLLALAVALAAGAGVLRAEDLPTFDLPLACTVGTDCFVQNYVDHDPGPGAQDFTCGHLTYDGHKGTDIRLPDYADMHRGVAVLAAAPGVVARLRDGMEDVNVHDIGRAALNGKDAGNSVVVSLGNGWETQYAHMRKGSIVVKIGQRVEVGQKLGLVGLSGDTEFPHVHFEVRYKGKTVDPYTGPEDDPACGKAPHPMWSATAGRKLAYRPSGVVSAGLTDRVVTEGDVLIGGERTPAPKHDGAILAFFVSAFGVHAGDIEDLRIVGPDGTVLAKSSPTAKSDFAIEFALIGRKIPKGGWPAGSYRGEYELIRQVDGQPTPVAHVEREFVLP